MAARVSPVGCSIGVLALLPLAFSGVSVWGLIKFASADPENRPAGSFQVLIGSLAGGVILTAALVWLGVKAWGSANSSNDRLEP